jgi:Acetyltransferase (GNAT) domain
MSKPAAKRATRSSRLQTTAELYTKDNIDIAVWEDIHQTIISTCSENRTCRENLAIEYLHQVFKLSTSVLTIRKEGTKGLAGFSLMETRMYQQENPKKVIKIMFLHAIYGIGLGKTLWTYINDYAMRSFVSYIFIESTLKAVSFYLKLGFVFYDTSISSIAVSYQKSPPLHNKLQHFFHTHYHRDISSTKEENDIGKYFLEHHDWNELIAAVPMMYKTDY